MDESQKNDAVKETREKWYIHLYNPIYLFLENKNSYYHDREQSVGYLGLWLGMD